MSSLAPLPYYKWLVKDYRASRRVQRMPWQGKGLMRELLDEQWLEGPLPLELSALAEIAGCTTEEMETYWPYISGCFQEEGGRLLNAKLESLRTEMDATRVARIAAGRAGGIAKHSLAFASQVPASAKQVLSTCHIEEGEKSKEEVDRRNAIHLDFGAYISEWNARCGSLPKVSRLTVGRRDKLRARLHAGLTINEFCVAVAICAKTPFLRGEQGFRASFDWLITNDTNLAKVTEGNYGKSVVPEALGATLLDKLREEVAHA